MILINSTPYRDCDMPDENLHSSVGCDRQLEDPRKDHDNLSSVMKAESIDNSELELVIQNCFGTNLEQELGCGNL